jgi:MFS family permease
MPTKALVASLAGNILDTFDNLLLGFLLVAISTEFHLSRPEAVFMVLIYSQLTSQYALLIGGGIMGIFVNGMIAGLGTLMSELYPTEARGTAESGIFNVGRGFGGFGPLVVGILATQYSFGAAIAWLSSIYLIELIATAALIPERKGVALE